MSYAMINTLPGADRTCDVSFSELEIIAPSFFHNTLDLPVIPDWVRIDRMFAGVLGGTCMLMLGSVLMIVSSLKEPEPVQASHVPKAVVVAPVDLPATPAEVRTQTRPAKSRGALAKRRPRKLAAKAPTRGKLAARPLKPRKRMLGAR